jgi:hypothetical protein
LEKQFSFQGVQRLCVLEIEQIAVRVRVHLQKSDRQSTSNFLRSRKRGSSATIFKGSEKSAREETIHRPAFIICNELTSHDLRLVGRRCTGLHGSDLLVDSIARLFHHLCQSGSTG